MTRRSPLVLAVPSKGRLQENAAAFFAPRRARARAGARRARLSRHARGRAGRRGAFLSASEIVDAARLGRAPISASPART